MNILDELESRISQLLDNMSLMQMEIEELNEKNHALQTQLTQAQSLEAEVAKIRAEQAMWQNRLQQLLGKIDDVSAQEDNKENTVSSSMSSPVMSEKSEEMPFHAMNQNFTP